MMLALLVTALLGQTVYEWTDAQGETHYTDDPSSIPKGVKARTTTGADIAVVPTSDAAKRPTGPDSGAPPKTARPQKDRCAEAKAKVTALEERLAAAKKEHELALLRWNGDCQAILRTHGQAEYAKCSRKGRKSAEAPAPRFGELEKQLSEAQDALRRVQVAGCFE